MNYYAYKMRAPRSHYFSPHMNIRHLWQLKKIKILGAVLELPAKQRCQFSPFGPIFEVNGLDWQYCSAGSSKTAPRVLTFSIFIDADYSYEVKNSEIWAPAFFMHNNSFIATVWREGWANIARVEVTLQKRLGWPCLASLALSWISVNHLHLSYYLSLVPHTYQKIGKLFSLISKLAVDQCYGYILAYWTIKFMM